MNDRDREHLAALVGHAQAAVGYAKAHGRGWWKNSETLDAVLMCISQVGEAASRTSPEALAEVADVTWRDVKGMRARIVHDYQGIDVLIIRGVVSRQLPRLITSVGRALVEEEKSTGLANTAPPPTTGPQCRPISSVPRFARVPILTQ
jgi:uncharacterized protein with HEPN domain